MITYPCLRYLLLAAKSSHNTLLYILLCPLIDNWCSPRLLCRWSFKCKKIEKCISWLRIITSTLNVIAQIAKFMGPTWGPSWVQSAPDGSHVGPMNLAIREVAKFWLIFVGENQFFFSIQQDRHYFVGNYRFLSTRLVYVLFLPMEYTYS